MTRTVIDVFRAVARREITPEEGAAELDALPRASVTAPLGLCSSAAYAGIPHVRCHDCVGWEPIAVPDPPAPERGARPSHRGGG